MRDLAPQVEVSDRVHATSILLSSNVDSLELDP